MVLGMHRSGTSVIARGLQVMGVELGNELMPPAEGNNSKGFWEDLEINALNTEMLHFLRNDWHFLTPIQPIDVEILCKNGYLQRALALLEKKTVDVNVFGFKDPRAVKLLSFWKEVFTHTQLHVSYVLVIRHPLSVCESLVKRDGFANEKNYLLWLEHVLESLVNTENTNRVLVDYDRLMQLPEEEITRIAKGLNLTINKEKLEQFKLEFLDQNLRHTIYGPDDLMRDDAIPPLAREVYQGLADISICKTLLDDPDFLRKLSQWHTEFSRQRSALILADQLTLKIYQVMGEQKQVIQTLEARVADQDKRLKSLASQLQEVNEVKNSRFWKLTRSLRSLKIWLESLTRNFK